MYKYVVDDSWEIAKEQPIAVDDAGNENNYLDKDTISKFSSKHAQIPESGHFVPITNPESKSTKDSSDKKNGDFSTTVLPASETEHHTQATLGEVGIFIPLGEEQLKAFENVEETDAKALNEPEDQKYVRKRKVKAKKAEGGATNDAHTDINSTIESTLHNHQLPEGAQIVAITAATVEVSSLGVETEPQGDIDSVIANGETDNSKAALLTGAGAGATGAAAAHGLSSDPEGYRDVSEPVSKSVEQNSTQQTPGFVNYESGYEGQKTLDPKASEVHQKSTDEPILDVVHPKIAGSDGVAKVEEIVIADSNLSKRDIIDEVHAVAGEDAIIEEFTPSKAEVEQLKLEVVASTPIKEIVKSSSIKKNDKHAGSEKKQEKSTKDTKASSNKKEKKQSGIKRFFKKILD